MRQLREHRDYAYTWGVRSCGRDHRTTAYYPDGACHWCGNPPKRPGKYGDPHLFMYGRTYGVPWARQPFMQGLYCSVDCYRRHRAYVSPYPVAA